LGTWAESIAPVFGSAGSNFGAAIVVDDNSMWSIGAPDMTSESGVEGAGSVVTSTFINGNWELIPALYGKNAGDAFGTALDLSMNHMIVGSPNALIANTSTPAGAAYYYSFDPSTKVWTESDYLFRSSDDLLSSNGAFGAAVALGLNGDSGFPRVVIGAPKYNVATDALEVGRVYTLESVAADGSGWTALESNPIVGRNAYDWFGVSVDMSLDGLLFIVGAPGVNASGYFQVYEWDGSQWNVDYEQEGFPDEAFGSNVVFLTADVFAVGGPGYENGSGRVFVYQQSDSGYVILGEPIVGNPGDLLGSAGTISGGDFGDDAELILVVSSATGIVMTYVFDETLNTWRPRFETLSTGTDTSVVLEYSNSAGLVVGYPAGDEVSFYSGQTGVAAPPTSAPTIVNAAPFTATPTALAASPVTNPPSALGSPPITTFPTAVQANNSTPPASDGTWVLAGASFTPVTEVGSDFGASVSLTSTTMVVGAPYTLGNGALFVYNKNSGIWTTDASQQLFGNAAGMEFGSAVDLSSTLLAVGAPRADAPGTFTEFGAVYPFALVNGQWEALGGTLWGDEDIYSASEMFGSAVATADSTNRIAVGAPFSNLDNLLLRGRVYVYEYSITTSNWTVMQTMAGQDANHLYGSSVDISPDGTQLVVGAPGGGYAEFWEFDGSTIWTSRFLINQGTPGFGTTVVWISGNLFAVSDPNFNSDTGRVVLYQNDATLGTFVPLDSELTGTASGEQFGKTLAGSFDASTSVVTLIVGTATGTVRIMNLDTSNTWVSVGATVMTNVTSLAAASAQEFVVGGSNAAEIYQWTI
jgi:FG-GAP repeat